MVRFDGYRNDESVRGRHARRYRIVVEDEFIHEAQRGSQKRRRRGRKEGRSVR